MTSRGPIPMRSNSVHFADGSRLAEKRRPGLADLPGRCDGRHRHRPRARDAADRKWTGDEKRLDQGSAISAAPPPLCMQASQAERDTLPQSTPLAFAPDRLNEERDRTIYTLFTSRDGDREHVRSTTLVARRVYAPYVVAVGFSAGHR